MPTLTFLQSMTAYRLWSVDVPVAVHRDSVHIRVPVTASKSPYIWGKMRKKTGTLRHFTLSHTRMKMGKSLMEIIA